MQFEWDEAKSLENLAKHQISFSLAAEVFWDPARIEFSDDRFEYSEPRWSSIGLVDGLEIFVAYTIRDEHIRLISARKASKKEREDYWNR